VIITQTPYRVSFAGGGTDLPAYYQNDFGAVLSVAVNHHMYVTVSPRFEKSTRVAYTKVDIGDTIDEIDHTIAREALRMTGLGEHLEITTVGDVPGGTGMGSSSTLTVGLLNALNAYKGLVSSPGNLADKACEIEIDILGNPIGRQDQYAAAFGGLNYMRFNPDHSVDVEPVPYDPAFIRDLEDHVILLYTDQQRDANKILKKQSDGSAKKMDVLDAMRDQAADGTMLRARRAPWVANCLVQAAAVSCCWWPHLKHTRRSAKLVVVHVKSHLKLIVAEAA